MNTQIFELYLTVLTLFNLEDLKTINASDKAMLESVTLAKSSFDNKGFFIELRHENHHALDCLNRIVSMFSIKKYWIKHCVKTKTVILRVKF